MDVSVLNFDEASLGYLLLAHRPLFSIEREVFSLFLDKLSMPAMETAAFNYLYLLPLRDSFWVS